ncbi:ABC transporter permease [Streptomyces bathyalis]|uniref:ABC transporter permease n=1 Tax=Streptomyces bathyalis TaxID=2710756 RepID=A0A7T1WUY0_9ACTN|nr:ABC transporter permease [Streptomyces bathyalis]QPP10136.1 ABC transporter permease [Streptomyces bathyalis]
MPGSSLRRPPAPHPRALLAVLLLVPAIVALALWAFAWPAARTAPRDLPVGVAGPPAAAASVEQKLSRDGEAFEIHRYDDEAAARDAIERREVYGAVVATPKGPHALTASAASPVVAQALQQVAGGPSGAGTASRSTDVVAAPEVDPRGAALSSSVLPLAIGGVAAGAMVAVLGLRGTRAVVALLGSAALSGAVAAALTHSWLGVLTGNWWAESASFGLFSLAVSASVAGLGALLGRAGIGSGAMAMVLFGNPFSGVTSAPEMLPEPLGTIGQWLPPGAGATLLRSVGFFDGSASDSPVLVLTVWAVAGLTFVTVGGLRKQTTEVPEDSSRTGRRIPTA